MLELVGPALEVAAMTMGRDQHVAQLADLARAVVRGNLDETSPYRLDRLVAQPWAQLVHLDQSHCGVADRDPGPQHRCCQGQVADRAGRMGHLHQLARPGGSERGSPLNHPPGSGGTVRARHHTPAQRLGHKRHPRRVDLPGQVVNLTQERTQLVVADPDHHLTEPGQQRRRGGHARAARVDRWRHVAGRRRVDRWGP